MAFWRANDHEWGKGRIHLIDDRREGRTLCGKQLKFTPGRKVTLGPVDCLGCRQAAENRKKNDEYALREQETIERRERERVEWWVWYNAYLDSSDWRELRERVLKRAKGICEACGKNKAFQVHHLTYDRVGDEMLFDLVAVCQPCHDKLHPEQNNRINKWFEMQFYRALNAK